MKDTWVDVFFREKRQVFMKRVTIQGTEGCFHDAAAREYFKGEEIETIPCETFQEMFDALRTDSSLYGVLAIENTIAGSLLQNHELLRQSNHTIIGEHKLHIEHCLCALPGQTIDDLTEVYSHQVALWQCEKFLDAHRNLKAVTYYDTAGAAKDIAHNKRMGHGAICGTYAANLYGLNILETSIQTNKRNSTRFLILADPVVAHDEPKRIVNKASIVFTLQHKQGSLAKVLTIFSFYDINLSKIQSHPIIGREWEYRFYVNLTFDDYIRYQQAIMAVRPLINDFKILGEYEEFKAE